MLRLPVRSVRVVRVPRQWSGARERKLLQCGERSAEVHVDGFAVDHESGHGFDPGGGGFCDAVLGVAKMNDLDMDLGRVEVARDDLFGFQANGTSGVIEFGGGFHGQYWLSRVDGMNRFRSGVLRSPRRIS